MVKPREPNSTYDFIDDYCQPYRSLFDDVRNFEYFKFLHVGILDRHRPKSFDGIARIVGLKNGQRLKALFSNPCWNPELIQQVRLDRIRQSIGEQEIVLCLNEWGVPVDKTIDYVCNQYLSRYDKTQQGIVSINSYAIVDEKDDSAFCVYPLLFKVFKPQSCLKGDDQYKTKSQIAQELSVEISQLKFKTKLVLADKFPDESTDFVEMLNYSKVPFILAIHSDENGVVVPQHLNRNEEYRQFRSLLIDYPNRKYLVRRIPTGSCNGIYYYEVSKKSPKNPAHTKIRIVQANLKINEVREAVSRPSWWMWNNRMHKRPLQTLGWLDIQATDYSEIERWWEMVFGAYLIGSLWANRDRAQPIATPTNIDQKSMVDFPFGELLRAQLSLR